MNLCQIVCIAVRQAFPVVLAPIRARCLIFETQINANFSVAMRCARIFDERGCRP